MKDTFNSVDCSVKRLIAIAALAGAVAWATPLRSGPVEDARQVLQESGVKGGLVVHAGCGDGKLTAALQADPAYIVQGLETDSGRLGEARKNIQASGAYGPVSVVKWDGKQLPYAENLVNLLVAEEAGLRVSPDEILRVLAPLGVACVRGRDGTWKKTIKPWPKEIDEWTHWMHDAGNNAVAHDSRVGSPQRMQWVAEPLWSRGHEIISSVGGVVTAHGRIIYVLDEGQPGVYEMPSKWMLVARNAFNGVLLWKKPVPDWDPPVVPGGHAHGFKPRRLMTEGDCVYLPTGADAVLTAVDATTGKTLKRLESATGTTEILCSEGVLLAVVSPEKKGAATLLALRPQTLEVLWKVPVPVLAAETTALGSDRVFFRTGKALTALDLRTGKEVWRLPYGSAGGGSAAEVPSGTVVVHDGKVYCGDASGLMAISATDGSVLWAERETGKRGKKESNVFVTDGLIWRFQDPKALGYDPATGKLSKTIDASSVFSKGHHLRCYPGKATDSYMITPNRGAEFIGLKTPELAQNDWLRGNCGHGVMPANGLLYAPPNQCFCYGGVMLSGFKSLAASSVPTPADPLKDPTRLEHGPAFDKPSTLNPQCPTASDWPMYRHDPARLGATVGTVPAELRQLWKLGLGSRLTQPVVAHGMLVVAARDAHAIHSFDAQTGKPLWSYTAGSRIDSSPTLYQGLVLFGCADGWAYCLRAADGQLVWRFRAAPTERYVGAFGQIESAWPIHGSVVVVKGVAYFTAGRETYLDGGLFAYGLDPKSGRIVHYRRLEGAVVESPDKQGEKPFVPAFHIEGARSDLLVSDGTYLFLGPLKLNTKLEPQPTPYIVPKQKATSLKLDNLPYVDQSVFAAGRKRAENDFYTLGVLRGPMGDKAMGLRMLATGGFLDDSWYNRNYWMYSKVWPGFYLANLSAKAGELLVADSTTTYAVQAYPTRSIHSPTFNPGSKGYLLLADDNTNEPLLDDRTRDRDKGMGFTRAQPPRWSQWVPVLIRGMVKAGDTLFVAGPPDVFDKSDPYAALEGRKGALLWAVRPQDGKKVAEVRLDWSPVFDGMVAAGNRLYLSCTDGSLICLGKE